MSAVRISTTALADIPAAIDFINNSWVRTYAPLIGESVSRELAVSKHSRNLFEREINAPDALTFVAKSADGTIIGHTGGFQKDEGAIYIDRFHVAPEWHGKGVATPLMEAAADDARTKGFAELALTVLEGNDRAMVFYEKVGFEREPASVKLEGMGGRHAIAFIKRL